MNVDSLPHIKWLRLRRGRKRKMHFVKMRREGYAFDSLYDLSQSLREEKPFVLHLYICLVCMPCLPLSCLVFCLALPCLPFGFVRFSSLCSLPHLTFRENTTLAPLPSLSHLLSLSLSPEEEERKAASSHTGWKTHCHATQSQLMPVGLLSPKRKWQWPYNFSDSWHEAHGLLRKALDSIKSSNPCHRESLPSKHLSILWFSIPCLEKEEREILSSPSNQYMRKLRREGNIISIMLPLIFSPFLSYSLSSCSSQYFLIEKINEALVTVVGSYREREKREGTTKHPPVLERLGWDLLCRVVSTSILSPPSSIPDFGRRHVHLVCVCAAACCYIHAMHA